MTTFSNPGDANFSDARLVKPVHLDARSRQQQVNDGCFAILDETSRTALAVDARQERILKEYIAWTTLYAYKAFAVEHHQKQAFTVLFSGMADMLALDRKPYNRFEKPSFDLFSI